MLHSLRARRLSSLLVPLQTFVLALALPVFTFAAQCDGCLNNPLNSQFSSIPDFIAGALKILAIVALPVIALFIVISGFMFVFARGNEHELSTARKNFFYVIIGALLILGAWMIATLLAGTVTQLLGA